MSAQNRLAALRAQYAGNQQGESRETYTNKYYPFWNMKAGQRAVVRFLPDKDTTNPGMFMVEKVSHTLTINGQTKSVPCLSMYGEECPVCKLSQDYYKVNDKINGKKYWRKKQYIAQALIVEDPLPADKDSGANHQGQVRHIALGYQLYNIIKEAFAADDELEASPDDYNDGYDFIIKKTEQGDYATYTMGSKFSNKQRALTDEEVAIAEENSIELRTLLPRNPGVEKIRAMLQADLNGEHYEDEEGGQRQRPAESAPTPRPAPRPAPADDDEPPFDVTPQRSAARPAPAPVAAPAAGGGDTDVDAMLAAIRAKRAAAK